LILKLTKSLEAGIKEQFVDEENSNIFRHFINLVDEFGEKNNVIDVSEAFSFVLEFKVFFLLGILIFKKSTVKSTIKSQFPYILDFFKRKSIFYNDLVKNVIEYNDKLSTGKKNSIKLALTKFLEFVFFFFQIDNEMKKLSDFHLIINISKLVDESREVFNLDSDGFDVFKWIKKETSKGN
jgi:hypothetical protein